MKILLVDPPYMEEAGGRKNNFGRVFNRIPSLGLGYLAAVAYKQGHEVRVVDCNLGVSDSGLLQAAKELKPRVIGFSATTPVFSRALRQAKMLREYFPESVFVCGGAHPSADPDNALGQKVFDYLVLGEGEETFLELIDKLEENDPPMETVPGIAYWRNDRVFISEPRPRLNDLDLLPYPARNLLAPLSAYHPTPASYRRLPLAVVMTSRGCPSQCTFCDRQVFGEKFRQRSVANVMAEIDELINRYGAKEIRFFDDTLTVNPGFVQELCQSMGKLRIPWTCLTKVNCVNRRMLEMMRSSGCWQVLFGLESGDDFVLSKLSKGNTVENNRQAVLWARGAGLSVRADFLVGSPWETKESFRKTVEFAKSLPLDFAHFNKFVPYPGTAIYKELTAAGNRFDFNRGAYINNHGDFMYLPESFDENEYAAMLNDSYREFYLRPGYILRRLSALRSWDELAGQLQGLFSILDL